MPAHAVALDEEQGGRSDMTAQRKILTVNFQGKGDVINYDYYIRTPPSF